MNLNWNAVAGASGYTVQRATASGGPYATVQTTGAPSFTDFTTVNGVTYFYVVRATVGGEESSPSAEVAATPGTSIWTGAVGTAWEAPGNWNSVLPTNTSVAQFAGPLTANQPAISGANSVSGLLFESPGWTVNSASSGTLTIGGGGVVVNAGSGTITLNKAVTVLNGANRYWKGKTGSTLVLASLATPAATTTLVWGSASQPNYRGTLKLTFNGNGPNIPIALYGGTLQAHKSGWINSRNLTVYSDATFLVTYSNGDLIRSGDSYGVKLSGGQVNWNGFSETLSPLTLNGGVLRGSGSTIWIDDVSATPVSVIADTTLGDDADSGTLKFGRTGGNAGFDLGNATRTLTVKSPVEIALPVRNGSLLKTGPGKLTLSAVNDAGAITVMEGTLVVGAAGVLGTGSLTVASNAVCSLLNLASAVADSADLRLDGVLNLGAGVNETVARLFIDGVEMPGGVWSATRDPAHFTGTGNLIVANSGVPPPAPELVGTQVSGGRIEFQITGTPGLNYTVQASTNLVDWAPLLTTNSPVLPWTWADADTTNHSRRFYRALAQP